MLVAPTIDCGSTENLVETYVQESLDRSIRLLVTGRRLHFHPLLGWPDRLGILKLQPTRDQTLEI